jgi:hypothetical protein
MEKRQLGCLRRCAAELGFVGRPGEPYVGLPSTRPPGRSTVSCSCVQYRPLSSSSAPPSESSIEWRRRPAGGSVGVKGATGDGQQDSMASKGATRGSPAARVLPGGGWGPSRWRIRSRDGQERGRDQQLQRRRYNFLNLR